MEIVKKNILSIICGVVALLAIVFWFWPLKGIESEARAQLEKRAALYKQMDSLLKAPRRLPVVSLSPGQQQQELKAFPTENVIKWGTELTGRLAGEAQGVQAVAIRLNAKKELVQGSLPAPRGTTAFTFRDAYEKVMRDFAADMKAGLPPTPAEVEAEKAEIWASRYNTRLAGGDGTAASAAAQAQLKQEFDDEVATLAEKLRQKRAETLLVYMDPATALTVQVLSENAGTAPNAMAIWYAQVGLWIQQDIRDAVLATNAPFGSVTKAPIKNIVKMQLEAYRLAPALGTSPGGVVATPDASAGPSYLASPTGWVCNKAYDVIPFKLVIHIESDKVPMFLEQLARNRFITPYQVNLQAVNSVALGANNYAYGPAPVVQATISCETLMLRQWVDPLMPKIVKQQLGLEPPDVVAMPGM